MVAIKLLREGQIVRSLRHPNTNLRYEVVKGGVLKVDVKEVETGYVYPEIRTTILEPVYD